jgi:hypothetical protein
MSRLYYEPAKGPVKDEIKDELEINLPGRDTSTPETNAAAKKPMLNWRKLPN